MFLKNANLLFKSDLFKNIFILCIIIIITVLSIGFFSYKKINNYIVGVSREEILEEVDEYKLLYQEEGIDPLKNDILGETDEEDYFVNLIHNGVSIVEIHPESWKNFNIGQLPKYNKANENGWYYFNTAQDNFEIISYNLSNDTVLQIGQKINERNDFLKFLINLFFYSFIIILFIVLIIGFLTVDRSITPIRMLTDTINKIISSNKYNTRVELKSNDKLFDNLITNFNYMLDRVDKLINGMKDSLDNIAHDIRTPLTRFRLSAESSLVGSENGYESIRDSLQTCLEESDRILSMFNSILEISDANYGTINLEKKNVKLKETVSSIANIYEDVMEDNNIKISISIDDDIVLRADENKLLRAISNLIDNAIKYNNRTEGSISIKAYKQENKIYLDVEDTGIGIDEKELDRIFEKLYRIDKSRTKGHGLGLSYANAIIKAHNGIITVKSNLNTGSTFSIILPA